MGPIDLTTWRTRLSEQKEHLKRLGKISGEAALADAVSNELERVAEKPVQRTTINHWLSGRRVPNITQYLALCRAMQLDPGAQIGNAPPHKNQLNQVRAAYDLGIEGPIEALNERMRRAAPETRRLAIEVARAVLEQPLAEQARPQQKRK